MSLNDELSPHGESNQVLPMRKHRRSESEAGTAFGVSRSFSNSHQASDLVDGSPRWRGGGSRGGNAPLLKHRSASTKLFGTGSRRRFGSTTSPTYRPNSSQGSRHGRHGWRNDSNASADDDGSPKLVSLSDLIRKEDKVPATLLYEHPGDTDVTMDTWDMGGDLPQQAMNGGTVGVQDALQAAEHGNSIRLSKFLQDGGDPGTVSRLHHMRWSLLHLAAGCATMGGRLSFASYRSRPEPDCNDGYATCVSELLAAGADPNVTSSSRGYTPLMSAALTGSKECCWLLLRAGAKLEKKADDGRTAYDFAQKARHVGGGSTGGPRDTVMAVLRDPPKKVPRSPTLVKATLAERSCLEPEEAVSPVEVRWRVPSQASLAPASCGDVERYYVKCWCRGKAKEVIRSKTSTADVPRRDFCRNQIIDRGIALRKNLCLPQSRTASAIVHGLKEGESYSFTVSCVAEVEGALRHSPPSCLSKPLFIPESKEDHQWRLGGMLSMVTGKESPSPSGGGDGGVAQAQVRRVAEQSPNIVDQRRGTAKTHGVTWAQDDIAPTSALRQPASRRAREDANASPPDGFGRSPPSNDSEWDLANRTLSRSPARRRSQSYASSVTRTDPQAWAASRASLGGLGYSPPYSSPPQEQGTEGRNPFLDAIQDDPPTRQMKEEEGTGPQALTVSTSRSNRGFHVGERHDSFQDEGCSLS